VKTNRLFRISKSMAARGLMVMGRAAAQPTMRLPASFFRAPCLPGARRPAASRSILYVLCLKCTFEMDLKHFHMSATLPGGMHTIHALTHTHEHIRLPWPVQHARMQGNTQDCHRARRVPSEVVCPFRCYQGFSGQGRLRY